MRVGIVGEGRTDVHAITSFLRASLETRGVNAIFINLQPDMDRTNPQGGWAMVFKWLENNPPSVRIRSYFRGGLFAGDLSEKHCDVIVFQLDSDVLADEGFRNYARSQYGLEVIEPVDPIERGVLMERIIGMACNLEVLSDLDRRCHIIGVAVESTETWCIAAFGRRHDDPEKLSGQDLCDEFMVVLHRSEGRPVQPFLRISKSEDRWVRFCQKHSGGFVGLEAQCYHYRSLVEKLQAALRN